MKTVRMPRPIRVETPRCVLSEMRPADSSYWFGFMSDPRINRFLPDRISTQEEMTAILTWLAGNYDKGPDDFDRLTLAVSLKADERPIGWVTYGGLPEDEALREIGYALEPAHWGRGIATEAAGAFLDFIRTHMSPPDRIFATVDVENSGSIRVLEKLGMRKHTEGGITPAENHEIYVLERGRAR